MNAIIHFRSIFVILYTLSAITLYAYGEINESISFLRINVKIANFQYVSDIIQFFLVLFRYETENCGEKCMRVLHLQLDYVNSFIMYSFVSIV